MNIQPLPEYHAAVLVFPPSALSGLVSFPPPEDNRFGSGNSLPIRWSEIIFAASCQNEIKCVKVKIAPFSLSQGLVLKFGFNFFFFCCS